MFYLSPYWVKFQPNNFCPFIDVKLHVEFSATWFKTNVSRASKTCINTMWQWRGHAERVGGGKGNRVIIASASLTYHFYVEALNEGEAHFLFTALFESLWRRARAWALPPPPSPWVYFGWESFTINKALKLTTSFFTVFPVFKMSVSTEGEHAFCRRVFQLFVSRGVWICI